MQAAIFMALSELIINIFDAWYYGSLLTNNYYFGCIELLQLNYYAK